MEMRRIMADSLLVRDLEILENFEVEMSGRKPQSLIDFMMQPLLSGYNIKFSQGPRPRIVIGLKKEKPTEGDEASQ
jgi:hypothetical protein